MTLDDVRDDMKQGGYKECAVCGRMFVVGSLEWGKQAKGRPICEGCWWDAQQPIRRKTPTMPGWIQPFMPKRGG